MTHRLFDAKPAAQAALTALLAIVTILLLTTTSAKAETAAIHLNDGTTVRGEVIGLKDGSYQIRSSSLGTLNIPQSKIKLVEFNPATGLSSTVTEPTGPTESSAANSGVNPAALASITSRLQNSPEILNNITSLAEDPDIMSIVQDPEIQRLIQAGDYTSLMSNPKMQRLMSNSKIKNITRQLK